MYEVSCIFKTKRIAMTPYDTLVLAVYLFAFLVGLPANLLAFYTFLMKVRKKAAPIDILLFNLTISDVIILIFLPFKMVEAASDMTWPLPAFLCPLTGFCYYSSIYISTLFLTAISVERYLGVAYPIKYKLNRRPAYVIVASFFFWLLACSHCSIVYIVQYQMPELNETDPNPTNAVLLLMSTRKFRVQTSCSRQNFAIDVINRRVVIIYTDYTNPRDC
ncbi:hypothetical protein JD844_005685 [Phrynosoma platyrhinos]|uniref:Free fatty acid receptor 1 n=1 Tax=Phrynosoma platyrhinos TaxID=52577 RepID=A0ABQ7TPM2_PHRPL|nr:hypothetical protein JD844_005685 [Phrynosoma platyrhinos]